MLEATEAGFDRRSLIKKGLVTGGVIAAVPVISTFNAPAFAASPPGFRIHFDVDFELGLGGILILNSPPDREDTSAASDTGCDAAFEADWDEAAPDPGSPSGGPIAITSSTADSTLLNGVLTFTIVPPTDPVGLTFFGGRRGSTCVSGNITNGGLSISFDLGLITLAFNDDFYLIVN